jgi:hypothetical protein
MMGSYYYFEVVDNSFMNSFPGILGILCKGSYALDEFFYFSSALFVLFFIIKPLFEKCVNAAVTRFSFGCLIKYP